MLRALCLLLSASLAPAVFAGPEWTELKDAGSSLADAESPLGTGPIAGIKGELAGDKTAARGAGDYEDIYRIYIDDPQNFSAFIAPEPDETLAFDTQLWLFDRAGNGILANDDNPDAGMNGESGFENTSTDGSNAIVTDRGVYFLAITGAGNYPRNLGGGRIFNFITPGEISGPDGVIGSSPRLGSWVGQGKTGEYTVQVTGVRFIPPDVAVDFNADGCVGPDDLAQMLAGWGRGGRTDITRDNTTDSRDLAVLLAAWGCSSS